MDLHLVVIMDGLYKVMDIKWVFIAIQDVVVKYVGKKTLPNASELKDVIQMLLEYISQYVIGLVKSNVSVDQEIVQLIVSV